MKRLAPDYQSQERMSCPAKAERSSTVTSTQLKQGGSAAEGVLAAALVHLASELHRPAVVILPLTQVTVGEDRTI